MKSSKLKEKGYKYLYIFDVYPENKQKIPIKIYSKDLLTEQEIKDHIHEFSLHYENSTIEGPTQSII